MKTSSRTTRLLATSAAALCALTFLQAHLLAQLSGGTLTVGGSNTYSDVTSGSVVTLGSGTLTLDINNYFSTPAVISGTLVINSGVSGATLTASTTSYGSLRTVSPVVNGPAILVAGADDGSLGTLILTTAGPTPILLGGTFQVNSGGLTWLGGTLTLNNAYDAGSTHSSGIIPLNAGTLTLISGGNPFLTNGPGTGVLTLTGLTADVSQNLGNLTVADGLAVTFADPLSSPVTPEPASAVLLLGSGLVFLARRRR